MDRLRLGNVKTAQVVLANLNQGGSSKHVSVPMGVPLIVGNVLVVKEQFNSSGNREGLPQAVDNKLNLGFHGL